MSFHFEPCAHPFIPLTPSLISPLRQKMNTKFIINPNLHSRLLRIFLRPPPPCSQAAKFFSLGSSMYILHLTFTDFCGKVLDTYLERLRDDLVGFHVQYVSSIYSLMIRY